MEENKNSEKLISENTENSKPEYDKSFREIISKADKENQKIDQMSKSQIEALQKDIFDKSFCYDKKIGDIKIPSDSYVVFTDGNAQLLYENGEFFITSSTDSTTSKKKIKKEQAKELHLEYFMRYILNKVSTLKDKSVKLPEIEVEKKEQQPQKKTKEVKLEKLDKPEVLKNDVNTKDLNKEQIKESLSNSQSKTVTQEIEIERIKNKIKAAKTVNDDLVK